MYYVIVSDYNPLWPDIFEAEAAKLTGIFDKELLKVHHIGSTSVPGLTAKPIIDIMPVVRNIEIVDTFNDQMLELGYEPMGEYGINGRRFFRKGGDQRTHHIHFFQNGSEHIERHLAFRDFLRANPDIAKRYGDIKKSLAERFPDDIEAYMDGKDPFIKEVEHKAVEWYRDC